VRAAGWAFLAALLVTPAPALAQMGGGVSPPGGMTVSGRLGYDLSLDAFALGASARVGLGRVPFELQMAGDATFLDRVTERQLAVDVMYRLGRGGLAFGGGPVFRNTFYETDGELGPRETRRGYSLVVALGGVPSPRERLVTGLEVRWIRVENFRPQTLMAQVGLALLRW
jgi:hypothetical protein